MSATLIAIVAMSEVIEYALVTIEDMLKANTPLIGIVITSHFTRFGRIITPLPNYWPAFRKNTSLFYQKYYLVTPPPDGLHMLVEPHADNTGDTGWSRYWRCW